MDPRVSSIADTRHRHIRINEQKQVLSHLLERLLGFPGVSVVKNLPAMQENWVGSLGQEDPLEKGIAIHSSILAWRSPWTEEPGGPWPMELQRLRHD